MAASAAGPPSLLTQQTVKRVAAGLFAVVVVVVLIATRPTSVESLPPITLSTNAVNCSRTSSVGTTLVCHGAPGILFSLKPAEREARLRATDDEAKKAGFTALRFQDGERIWRSTEIAP